jgi:predicted transcriptional regulator
MFKLRNNGWQNKNIAEKFKISKPAVSMILSGKRFSHLNLHVVDVKHI